MDIEDEFHRRGHFKIIFTVKETLENYTKFFEVMRYSNILLWKYLKSHSNFLQSVKPKISDLNV